MSRARPFAFGQEPVRLRAATQTPARTRDEITVPLAEYVAPVSPTWQGRPTLPLAAAAVPARPVLPFRTPAVTQEIARVTAPVTPREATLPEAMPSDAPRSRTGVRLAMAAAVLALYSAALVVVVAPRRTEVPVAAAASVLTTAPIVAPTSEASAPVPSPSASAAASLPSAPRAAPPRIQHAPAPARTARVISGSDVRDPWGF